MQEALSQLSMTDTAPAVTSRGSRVPIGVERTMTNSRFSVTTFVVCALSFSAVVLSA